MTITRVLMTLLVVGLLAGVPACASVQTHVSPVADVANAGGKIEDAAHAILKAAETAQGTGLITRAALDDVAIAINKIGHLGIDLKAGLDAYNLAKASGVSTVAQVAAIQQVITTLNQTLADIGKAIPNKTIAAVDAAVTTIVTLIGVVKGTVGL